MNDTLHSASSTFGHMNPLDWCIALLLAVSTVMAFLRGLIRSLISLAGVVLGLLLACLYAHVAGVWLSRWVGTMSFADVAGFVLILVAVMVLAALIGRAMRGVVSAVGLGFFDRLAGAAFGLLRGVLVLAAFLLPLTSLVQSLPLAQTSLLLPYLFPAAHGISSVVPHDFGTRFPSTNWLHHAERVVGRRDSSTVPSGAR